MGQHKNPVLCAVEDWTVCSSWKQKDKKKKESRVLGQSCLWRDGRLQGLCRQS